MEIAKQWSTNTLMIYLLLASLISILFALAIRSKNKHKTFKIYKLNIETKYIYYTIIYSILIIFLVFRYIGNEVGGADTYNYMGFFDGFTYIKFDIKDIISLSGYEYLFYNFMCLVKFFGGNFTIFEFFIYSFMIIAYIFIVDKFINDERECLMIILSFIPILKSLNIIRNIYATFIGYIALYFLSQKKYIKYLLFCIIAFLNHYIAIILIIYGIFDKIISKIINSKKKLLIFSGSIFLLSMVMIPIVQLMLNHTGFSRYINSTEISLYGYIPIIIFYVMLMLNDNLVEDIKKHNHEILYKTYIFQVIVLPVFLIINGAGRMLLFFELLRYILYADIYMFYRKKIPKKYTIIYDVTAVTVCLLWLAFRIWRMWDGYCLMPYYNILFM